jgi:hypothetical protein
MSRKWILAMVTGAAVLGVVTLGVVQSGAAKSAADLSGRWRLDAAKSDLPGRGGPGGFRGSRGAEGGGGWSGRGGWGGKRSGGGGPDGNGPDSGRREGRRGRRLPDFVQVTQQGGIVELSDSTGALLQQIRIQGAAAPADPAEDVAQLTGHWDRGTLVAERPGPRGGTMVQTYKLEDHGRTLEVRMEFKGGGSGEGPRRSGREIKLVYRRNG